ncbi:MAG: hypothetical protein AAB480_02705 [Patescibacteria group bacterium]
MGNLETEAGKERRKDYIQQAVLSAVAVAGILALTAVAPNTLQLLGGFGRKKYRINYQTKTVLSRLVEKGYVRFAHKDGRKCVEITSAGKRAANLEIQLNAQRTHHPKKWDKRWRLVMFDIPERRKTDRDHLRRTMMEAGFQCFQDSVWVFPYDCEDLISLLKIDMHLGNAVRYAIVEKLENDAALRKYFKLGS